MLPKNQVRHKVRFESKLIAKKSDNQSDKSEYTQIIKEPTPEKRKRRTRLTRSNLDIVVSSITGIFASFFRLELCTSTRALTSF